MELVITKLLDQYERGGISRRGLIGALVMVTTASRSSEAADFQTKSLDHVSVVSSNPQRSAEFYQAVFGLQTIKPSAAAVAGGALSDGSIRLGGGKTFLVLRPGATPGVVDHFAFGVDPFEQNLLAKSLNSRGIQTFNDPQVIGFHVKDPDGVAVQFTTSK